MSWEERLLALFDDLEQQAEGLALADRDVEVAELSRSGYAEVALDSRLHASVGAAVRLAVAGVGAVSGRLCRAGADWCLVADGGHEWLVRFAAVTGASGLSGRSLAPAARILPARLSFGSALREVGSREPVLLRRVDGTVRTGTLGRVGADFTEVLAEGAHEMELVPFPAIAAVEPRGGQR